MRETAVSELVLVDQPKLFRRELTLFGCVSYFPLMHFSRCVRDYATVHDTS